MGSGVDKRFLVMAPLLVALSNACSLDQRSGDREMARIQLNTRSRSGGPARLATIPGTVAPTASSYYIVDVEGEGIPRSILEPANCFKVSPGSSAMVPAIPNPGESQLTEIDLLVPIGAQRKIRIYRVELSLLPASPGPMFGESPFAFKVRNPQYTFSGEKFLLAEAEIPFLTADQSVTLVERAVAQPLGNQCANAGPPPISNGEVQLTEYGPFGAQALWNSPYAFKLKGRVSKLQAGLVAYSVVTPACTAPSGTVTVEGSPPPAVTFGGPSPAPTHAWFSRVFTFTPPVALPLSQVVTGTVPYTGGSLASISWTFPMTIRSESAPLSLSSSISATPLVVGGMTYGNTYQAQIQASRAVELAAIQPGSDLFGYYTGLASEPAIEVVPPPPSATGTPCPLAAPGSPTGVLSLNPSGICDVYVRTYQQSGAAHYVLNLKSLSGGVRGVQTVTLTQAGGLTLSLNNQGESFIDGLQTTSPTLMYNGVNVAPSATPSLSGSWVVPIGDPAWTLFLDQVYLKYANGAQCSENSVPYCGVSITAGSPTSLTFPTHLANSPLAELSVVVRKVFSTTSTYYRQSIRLRNLVYIPTVMDDAAASPAETPTPSPSPTPSATPSPPPGA